MLQVPSFLFDLKDQGTEGPRDYIHISQNEFSYRKHVKQKEEDVSICDCKFDACDPESACGEACLNVLTSTECTPGFCPCGIYCKNEKFQRCEYAKTKLVNAGGRGWGLVADEDIKGGQFIIEYCGEVISWKEAKRRTQAYESQGIKDAFIIALNAFESIDATRKGSLARFINHSCQPNCETRKWTVLGEIRVGIFAKHDIPIGTELAYDYNFEWYGGAKVRCLCGAANCSGFLGAKSRGFQEDAYNWEDDDNRFSIEKIPLYDSAEDEPSSNLLALDIVPADAANGDAQNSFLQKNAVISEIPSGGAGQSNHVQSGAASKKKLKRLPKGWVKNLNQKELDAKSVARLLVDKEAQDEIFTCEEIKNDASSNLESLYNEIRPAIEEHERDTQDSVPTNVAEKWIEASCSKLKAEFDLYFAIIKNVACTPKRKYLEIEPPADNEPKLLMNH